MPGRPHRLAALVTALVLAPSILPGSTVSSLARWLDQDASSQAVATDTLNPPTALGATGGTSAALTWIATVDTYAAGYEVRRATVSGGPYATVATVSPRTVAAATDTPPTSGTYYYVLRSTFQSWTSSAGNQASATISLGPTATGYNGCTTTSSAADTGGDNNGYELLAANACTDDMLSASDVSTGTNNVVSCTDAGKDRHRYWDFGLGMPAVVTSVAGIQVRADVGMNNNGGTNQLCAQLSWDGGTSWTATKSVALSGSAIATYALGAANDTWGRTWVGGNFSNADFRVRLIDVTSQPTKTFLLEYLAVQVTYTP